MMQALFLTNSSSSDSSKAQDYDTEGEELIDELRDLQPSSFCDSNNGKIAPQLFSAPNGRTVGSHITIRLCCQLRQHYQFRRVEEEPEAVRR
jgi:hypothetical protein